MISATTSPTASIANIPVFNYTAKWICNTPASPSSFNTTVVNVNDAENIGLVPGEYKTDINVHNPNAVNVSIVKKFVVSLPESSVMPRPGPTAFAKTVFGPDVAFFITCNEIQKLLNLPALHAFKGFVILQTTAPNLDVVAEYSSQAFDFSPECPSPSFPPLANTSCVEGLTLDVERITPVTAPAPIIPPPTCSPQSAITITPASVTLPRGSNFTATVVISNSPCTTITECFTITFSPSVPSGFFVPSCITLPPGTSGAASLVIFIPTTAPTGLYTGTITATCAACSPVLVQTATITLNVV